MVCAPSIAATAAFLAIIFLDLYNRDYGRIPGHALMGVFAVLLISFICERTSSIVGWILLGSPFALVFLGYFVYKMMDVKTPVLPSTSTGIYPCQCCNARPCRCFRPCSSEPRPTPSKPCPVPPSPPKPGPKPKPDGCIDSSLKD